MVSGVCHKKSTAVIRYCNIFRSLELGACSDAISTAYRAETGTSDELGITRLRSTRPGHIYALDVAPLPDRHVQDVRRWR